MFNKNSSNQNSLPVRETGFASLAAILFISALLVLFGFMIEIGNYMYSLIKVEEWTDIAAHSTVNAYNQIMKKHSDELIALGNPDILLNPFRNEALESAKSAYDLIMQKANDDFSSRLKITSESLEIGTINDPDDHTDKDSFKVVLHAKYQPVSNLLFFPAVDITRSSERYSK